MRCDELCGADAAKLITTWIRDLDTSATAADVASQIKKSFLSFGEKKPATSSDPPAKPVLLDRPSPRRDSNQEVAALRSLLHELQNITRAERTAAMSSAGLDDNSDTSAAASLPLESLKLLPGEQHLVADLAQQRALLVERQQQLTATLGEMDVEGRKLDQQSADLLQQCESLRESLNARKVRGGSTEQEATLPATAAAAPDLTSTARIFSVVFPSEAELEGATTELLKVEQQEAELRSDLADRRIKHELDLRRARQNLRDWHTHLHALLVEEERRKAAAASSNHSVEPSSHAIDKSHDLSLHAQNLTKLAAKLRLKEQRMLEERQDLRALLRSEPNEKKAIAAVLRQLREPVVVDTPT